MRLIVNGAPHEHHGAGTLVSLLRELGANGDRVATMLNDEIIGKGARSHTKLCDGDRVEVLIFAGGG